MDFILKIVLNSRILIRSTRLQLKLKSLSEIEKIINIKVVIVCRFEFFVCFRHQLRPFSKY